MLQKSSLQTSLYKTTSILATVNFSRQESLTNDLQDRDYTHLLTDGPLFKWEECESSTNDIQLYPLPS